MTEIRRTPQGPGHAAPQSPSSASSGAPAIDRAHLSRQCFDDERLEAELLLQFRIQALSIAAELGGGAGSSPGMTADLAHRLRGSALAIGAGRVARAAAIVEACGRTAERGGAHGPADTAKMSQALSELGGAVLEAVAEIERAKA